MTNNAPELPLINHYVDYYASRKPDADALVINDQRISYAQLKQQMDACAKGLIAAGVKPGDRVATLCTAHPDYFVIFMAAASIGAIWMGLNPKYQLDEYRYVLGDAQPVILFSRTHIGERDYRETLATLIMENPCIKQLISLECQAEEDQQTLFSDFLASGASIGDQQLAERRAQVKPRDPALLVYTSGSTGKPKGALLPHRGLCYCSRVQLGYLGVNPVRCVNYFPINHVACVSDLGCYTLVGGGTCIYMEKFDAEQSVQLMEKERATLWFAIPTGLQMAVDLPNFKQYDLSSLQAIVWGGAAAPAGLVERLTQINCNLFNIYGLTETVGNITHTRPGDSHEVLINSVGKPAEAYQMAILDNQGKPLPIGKQGSAEGEIAIRGDFVMTAYLNKPEATAETIDANGWLHTGDLGRWRADGNLQLVGRSTERFKSGGYNVYPREIEQVLEAHPDIAMAVVVPVPHSLFGEVGLAYLQPQSYGHLSLEEIEVYCRDKLANYKIPKQFVIKKQLPLLAVGKVDRKALKQEAQAMPEPSSRAMSSLQPGNCQV